MRSHITLAAVLLLLCCFICLASAYLPQSTLDTKCTELYECISEDDDCEYSWQANPDVCSAGATNGTKCCALGLVCNAAKECAVNNYGDTCTLTAQCMSGLGEQMICSNGKCLYLSQAGDKCDDTSQCDSGLTCTDELCVGQAFGASCATLPCNNGLYCNAAQTCQYLLAPGSACTIDEECTAESSCNNKVCTVKYSVEKGDQCSTDSDCDDGNVCSANKCVVPTEVSTCSSNSDCNGGLCVCSPYTGKSYCAEQNSVTCNDLSDAVECQTKYNCTNMWPNENSCFSRNCHSDLEDMQSCACSLFPIQILGDCYYSDQCGGFPGWAVALILIGLLLVILAVVAVVFVMMRRRKYDSL